LTAVGSAAVLFADSTTPTIGAESAMMTPRELSDRRNRCVAVRFGAPWAMDREFRCSAKLVTVHFFLE